MYGLLIRFLTRYASRHVRTIDGLEVRCRSDVGDPEAWLSRVESAFVLLREAHPKALQRLHRIAALIVVTNGKVALGEWDPRGRIIEVSSGLTDRVAIQWQLDPIAILASTLVHESTHARLGELGLDFMSAPLRHERLCIREEEHFARRIDNARLQENVRAKRYRNVDELATFRDTNERDILDQLASLGVPSSALFVLTRLAQARSQRNRKRWRGGA